MLTKSLLAIAFLATLSASAQAGSTISDKSYWPNEARRTTSQSTAPLTNPYSAFAYDRGLSRPAPTAFGGGLGPRYQGGPKGR